MVVHPSSPPYLLFNFYNYWRTATQSSHITKITLHPHYYFYLIWPLDYCYIFEYKYFLILVGWEPNYLRIVFCVSFWVVCLKLLFEIAFVIVWVMTLFWSLFQNNFYPSKKISFLNIAPSLVLKMVVLLQNSSLGFDQYWWLE